MRIAQTPKLSLSMREQSCLQNVNKRICVRLQLVRRARPRIRPGKLAARPADYLDGHRHEVRLGLGQHSYGKGQGKRKYCTNYIY